VWVGDPVQVLTRAAYPNVRLSARTAAAAGI
jgi:hypothetical protein